MEKNLKNFRSRFINKLAREGKLNFLSDEKFLKLKYWANMGHKHLNLKNPQTFNEKLQWLKLYDRNPLYTKLVDKYLVKDYVASIIGEDYVVPLLGVWNNSENIDWNNLPNQFVLKVNHAGGVYICVDKDNNVYYDKAHKLISKEDVIRRLTRDLNTDYYMLARSWQYKNVERKIIAEKMLEIGENENISDYKFFCFDGKVEFYYIVSNRSDGVKCTFFDVNDKKIDVCQHDPCDDMQNINFPKNLDLMKKLASKLSKNIPHVRVDFYEVNGYVYFGEFTFHNWAGFTRFEPEEYDLKFGNLIDLNKAYCYQKTNEQNLEK